MTDLTLHHLNGCSPAPLANYLKALGLLRLVSEQADANVRGWWQDEHFCLVTTSSQGQLEAFFLNDYQPTPLLSPWNRGSGLLQKGDAVLSPIEKSTASRFEVLRSGLRAARQLTDELSTADAIIRAIKDRTKSNTSYQSVQQRQLLKSSDTFKSQLADLKARLEAEETPDCERSQIETEMAEVRALVADEDQSPTKQEAARLKQTNGYKRVLAAAEKRFRSLKGSLIPNCRLQFRGPHARWLQAAVVLAEDGSPMWPSLLGTGGNDGRLDFTNNFIQRLATLFDLQSKTGGPSANAHLLLSEALWGQPTGSLGSGAIGQYLPSGVGGANSTTGADGTGLVNPWDFVLMMEGTILFSCRATRRLDPVTCAHASAPFAVRSHAAGYASRGAEKATRGEQWMPVWSAPATAPEIESLLGEARVQLKRQTAYRPVDVARAISRLGVARGIDAFTRFGYLERNGQANLAVPLGRIQVRHHPRAHLLDDIAPWMDRLQRLASDSHAPARLIHTEKQLTDSVMAALTHDYSVRRWQAILRAAVAVEAIQASGTAFEAGPIPPLRPEWIAAGSDDSAEFRLALAFGSAAAGYSREGKPYDHIRAHWLPLERAGRRFQTSDNRLAHDTRVVMKGRDLCADCCKVVERRLVEAARESRRRLPLVAAPGCSASLNDVAMFIAGGLDQRKLHDLARAFMAVQWQELRPEQRPQPGRDDDLPGEAWLAVRLACLPWQLSSEHDIPAEANMIRRLLSGDGTGAVSVALRRLRATGIRPPLQASITSSQTARLWAAALAFPINHGSARHALAILDPK